MKTNKKLSETSPGWSAIDPSDHHFRVEIPRTKGGEVLITENFIAHDPDLPPAVGDNVKPRVILPKARWEQIATVTRVEFNERSKKVGSSAGSWQAGSNQLPRSFGKELVLLAWAIEQAAEETIPTAIQNWLGLSPEERWWLYTQANAATGHADKGRGRGWRKAIQIALTENPIANDQERLGTDSLSGTSPRPRNADELRKSLTIR